MGDATRSQPKCLTRLAGRKLLDWQLSALAAAGIERVGLVTGYRRELLEPYARDFFHNERWRETNMVASLLCADSWLRETPVIVSYSDIVYTADHVRALLHAKAPVALTYDRKWSELWTLRFEDPFADAESFAVDASGRVVEIGNRITSLEQAGGQYMGLLQIQPAGWLELTQFVQTLDPSERDRLDMTTLLRGLIDAEVRIQGIPIDGRWCEVDSQSDLDVYQSRIAEAPLWSHDWRDVSASQQRTKK